MNIIDTHAHLDDKRFSSDLEDVIERAKQKKVSQIINVGINIDSSQKSVEMAKKYPEIYATVGVHPHDAKKVPDNYLDELKKMVTENKDVVVGIGEMGLDYFKNRSPQETQKSIFRAQLEFAKELQLPVIIHDRAAHEDALEIVKDFQNDVFGVFHCFAGDEEIASQVMDMGFYISFTGNISFQKADKLRDVVKYAPLSRIMIETDCPYMAPVPFRGKRNEPAFTRLVAEEVADIKGESFEDVVTTTTKNAKDLFRI
ncbi:TatD family hydrolase [Natranaerobius thermophilus]|uniref:Hydrolase, TatD family n=1 Tax=Natranaerobius thermophilus (strain ATCC BAA-1301 / DSM 18059 / JW/NM-WN-LF) TaxID=457570 RepID=B2A3L7_NATTJ|nr:TatD family hydrolase [Natranaerobius thermophilus]ACB83643.1 hydrolase, TatD family [Natranaerobius thermophilus JW/NM-WN-LF]